MITMRGGQKIVHNRRFAYGREYLRHYFDNLSFDFLFIKGDENPKFSIQDMGQMYLWEFPFLIVGIIFLFRKREGYWWLVPIWLIIGIIPAATARETPHALRIETTLPTFQLIVSYGIVSVFSLLRQYRYLMVGIGGTIIIIQLVYFLHTYFVFYPTQFSQNWQYGYKESIAFTKKNESSFDKIFVTTELGRPYIYYLFYLSVTPDFFRENSTIHRDTFGFVDVVRVGKYNYIKNISPKDNEAKILYIVSDKDTLPKNAKLLKEFKALNQEIVLRAYTL